MRHEVEISVVKIYDTDDLVNILSCITVDCPWCSEIDYEASDYADAKQRLKEKGNNDICYEEVLVEILEGGESLWFCDSEEDERYELTLEKLLNGIKLNAENRPDDSSIEDGDGETMDCIIQFALFKDIIFG